MKSNTRVWKNWPLQGTGVSQNANLEPRVFMGRWGELKLEREGEPNHERIYTPRNEPGLHSADDSSSLGAFNQNIVRPHLRPRK